MESIWFEILVQTCLKQYLDHLSWYGYKSFHLPQTRTELFLSFEIGFGYSSPVPCLDLLRSGPRPGLRSAKIVRAQDMQDDTLQPVINKIKRHPTKDAILLRKKIWELGTMFLLGCVFIQAVCTETKKNFLVYNQGDTHSIWKKNLKWTLQNNCYLISTLMQKISSTSICGGIFPPKVASSATVKW